MRIKIEINEVPVALIFNEDKDLLNIKVLSHLNTIIYTAKINKDNEMISEFISSAWIPSLQLDKFRADLEHIIIENI